MTLQLFKARQLDEAIAHAAAGDQALHMVDRPYGFLGKAPACFKRSQHFAHLLDQDKVRLVVTAKRLGVRRIVVHREGEPGQHVDLCGRPLGWAEDEAYEAEKEASHGK